MYNTWLMLSRCKPQRNGRTKPRVVGVLPAIQEAEARGLQFEVILGKTGEPHLKNNNSNNKK
jgi:hypothetical protein